MRPIRSCPNSACIGTPKISVIGEAGAHWRVGAARCAAQRASFSVTPALVQPPASDRRRDGKPSLHERAIRLALLVLERPERLIRGYRRADLVVVPGPLRLRRLFHFDEIRR